MIRYDHGTWGLAFLLRFRGSVFPKALVWAVPCSIVSVCFMYIKLNSEYADVSGSGTAMIAVGAFVSILGFMVIFRSNQAWARYWEGADLVQQARGEWISATSSLFAFCSSKPEMQEQVDQFQGQIVRIVSLLYAASLSTLSAGHQFELLDLDGLDQEVLQGLQDDSATEIKIELLLNWIQRIIMDNLSSSVVCAAPPITSRVFNSLANGVVKISSARKIREIQFPFHYAQMLGVMLIVYSLGVPAISAYIMETYWGCASTTFLNTFVLWCVNYLSVEIEQPFGDDPNDLPLEDEMRHCNRILEMLISDRARRPPAFRTPKAARQIRTVTLVAGALSSMSLATKTKRSDSMGNSDKEGSPATRPSVRNVVMAARNLKKGMSAPSAQNNIGTGVSWAAFTSEAEKDPNRTVPINISPELPGTVGNSPDNHDLSVDSVGDRERFSDEDEGLRRAAAKLRRHSQHRQVVTGGKSAASPSPPAKGTAAEDLRSSANHAARLGSSKTVGCLTSMDDAEDLNQRSKTWSGVATRAVATADGARRARPATDPRGLTSSEGTSR